MLQNLIYASLISLALISSPSLVAEPAKKGGKPGQVKKSKKAKKQRWCCMVDGEVAMKGTKEICVKARKEPTLQSKSKLVKKMAKSCKGTWEQQTPEESPFGAPPPDGVEG